MAKVRIYNGECHLLLVWPEHKFTEQKKKLDTMIRSREANEYIMELIERDLNPTNPKQIPNQYVYDVTVKEEKQDISEQAKKALKGKFSV